MNLTSMKQTKETSPEEVAPISTSDSEYPYGLEVRLEKESLAKLGMDVSDFSIGGTVDMVCQAEVTTLNESAGKGGDYSSISIQITDMALKQRPNETPKTLKLTLRELSRAGG